MMPQLSGVPVSLKAGARECPWQCLATIAGGVTESSSNTVSTVLRFLLGPGCDSEREAAVFTKFSHPVHAMVQVLGEYFQPLRLS